MAKQITQQPFETVIYGEPASKSNSRRIFFDKKTGKIRSIKSEKAMQYGRDFNMQLKKQKKMLFGDLAIELIIYYKTQRPDLDESLILDLLQGKVYFNDRQIKAKRVVHRIDKDHPRTHIRIIPMEVCSFASDI